MVKVGRNAAELSSGPQEMSWVWDHSGTLAITNSRRNSVLRSLTRLVQPKLAQYFRCVVCITEFLHEAVVVQLW